MHRRTHTRRALLRAGVAATFAGIAGAAPSPVAPGRVAALTVPPPTPLPVGAFRIGLSFVAGFAVAASTRTASPDRPYGYVNKTGAIAVPPQFEEARDFSSVGLALVKRGGKYGYINTSGDFVVPPRYRVALPFADNGLAAVGDGQGLGFINTAGDEVIPPQFSFDATTRFGDTPADHASPPLAAVQLRDGAYTFIDETGVRVFPTTYELAIPFSPEGFAAVKVSGMWGFIDRSGVFAVPPQYESVGFTVSEGVAWVSEAYRRGRLLHVPTNTLLTPPLDYSFRGAMRSGRIRATRIRDTVYLDQSGAVAIPGPFDQDAADFVEGVAAVSDRGGGYFITPDGTPLFGRTFTRVWSFSDGLAFFAEGVRAGFLDRHGAVVIPPQFFY